MSAGVSAAREVTTSTSGLLSADVSEKWIENSTEDRGKHVLKAEGASTVWG